ncbi:MAG TPA: DUF6327 family protein [Flavobacterium sp.]|nr:DUF6327 family protein [Flavobacterium sp.]
MKKRFTNFEDVDKQLEILKLEREIQLRKMGLKVEALTAVVTPGAMVKNGVSAFSSAFRHSSGLKSIVFTALIRFIIKQITSKKSS